MEVSEMRKKVFKAIAGCATACFMAGLIAVSGGNKDASAEDNYIANYTFEDGVTGDFRDNGSVFTIEEGKNSNAGEQFNQEVTGNACLKVDRTKGNDWWERNGASFDLKKLTPGVRYTVSVDVYHENDAVAEKGYGIQRAFKIGVFFENGYEYSGNDIIDANGNRITSEEEKAQVIETQNAKYNQIGPLLGAEKGYWERLEGTFTVKDDAASLAGNCYLNVFMAYPEEAGVGNNVSYTVQNKEGYYIDNFVIKEYVAPTPKPEASPTPVPSNEPTAVPPVATPYVDTTVGSGLEVGYEETVGNLLYVVTGNDTVQVKEFDTPKSSLVIPDTVVIEDYTFKVTSIAANAFKGDSDIKKLTIGANVTTIGKNAFFKCTSLKKITIKSSSITSIGKKAFKKTSAKATVKVPKAKKAAYKKLLKKAGIAKKAKIK